MNERIYILDSESLWLGAQSNAFVTIVYTMDVNTKELTCHNLVFNDKFKINSDYLVVWNGKIDITRLFKNISGNTMIVDLKYVLRKNMLLNKNEKENTLERVYSRLVNKQIYHFDKNLTNQEYNNIRLKLERNLPLTDNDFRYQKIKCKNDVMLLYGIYEFIKDKIDVFQYALPKIKFFNSYLKYGSYGV